MVDWNFGCFQLEYLSKSTVIVHFLLLSVLPSCQKMYFFMNFLMFPVFPTLRLVKIYRFPFSVLPILAIVCVTFPLLSKLSKSVSASVARFRSCETRFVQCCQLFSCQLSSVPSGQKQLPIFIIIYYNWF